MKAKYVIVTILIVVVGLYFLVGKLKMKNLDKISPEGVMSLYLKARDNGNVEILRNIIYFPPEASEEEKVRLAKAAVAESGEKSMMKLFFARIKTEYGRVIDDETAEVGLVIIAGINKKTPFQQITMTKDEGIWKYHYDRFKFTESDLTEQIRSDPLVAWPYYYLGRLYQPENPVRANQYYKKYYELEPGGFWADSRFINNLKNYEDIDEKEREALAKLPRIPKNAPDRSTLYRYLGQLFTEHGDYKKAEMYLEKAEHALKIAPGRAPLAEERLEKAKKVLESRMDNLKFDILMELEAEGAFD